MHTQSGYPSYPPNPNAHGGTQLGYPSGYPSYPPVSGPFIPPNPNRPQKSNLGLILGLAGGAVERARLMRVLPVAQRHRLAVAGRELLREARVARGRRPAAEVLGDAGVIRGGVRERLPHQRAPGLRGAALETRAFTGMSVVQPRGGPQPHAIPSVPARVSYLTCRGTPLCVS